MSPTTVTPSASDLFDEHHRKILSLAKSMTRLTDPVDIDMTLESIEAELSGLVLTTTATMHTPTRTAAQYRASLKAWLDEQHKVEERRIALEEHLDDDDEALAAVTALVRAVDESTVAWFGLRYGHVIASTKAITDAEFNSFISANGGYRA